MVSDLCTPVQVRDESGSVESRRLAPLGPFLPDSCPKERGLRAPVGMTNPITSL